MYEPYSWFCESCGASGETPRKIIKCPSCGSTNIRNYRNIGQPKTEYIT